MASELAWFLGEKKSLEGSIKALRFALKTPGAVQVMLETLEKQLAWVEEEIQKAEEYVPGVD